MPASVWSKISFFVILYDNYCQGSFTPPKITTIAVDLFAVVLKMLPLSATLTVPSHCLIDREYYKSVTHVKMYEFLFWVFGQNRYLLCIWEIDISLFGVGTRSAPNQAMWSTNRVLLGVFWFYKTQNILSFGLPLTMFGNSWVKICALWGPTIKGYIHFSYTYNFRRKL